MPHHIKRPKSRVAFIAAVTLPLSVYIVPGNAQEQAPVVDEVIEEQSEANDSAQQSQAVINTLDEDIVVDIAATREARLRKYQ